MPIRTVAVDKCHKFSCNHYRECKYSTGAGKGEFDPQLTVTVQQYDYWKFRVAVDCQYFDTNKTGKLEGMK